MRVFVTGATGFIGSELVRQLLGAGHGVVGLARSERNAERLRAAGAEAVVGDVKDVEVLRRGVARADAVAHLALPPAGHGNAAEVSEVAKYGTQAIVAACRGASLRSFVQASGALGMYRHERGAWIDETAPEEPSTPATHDRALVDRVVRSAHQREGLPVSILRPPIVYGDGGMFRTFFLDLMRRGLFRVVGDGAYHVDLVHVEDCAAAYRLALERAPAGETFLVSDDEPVTLRALGDHLAQLMGKRRPGRAPAFLAKIVAGADAITMLQESVRIRNRNLKERLGWAPRYPTYRDGLPGVVEAYRRAAG